MAKSICSENFKKLFSALDKIGLTIDDIVGALKDNLYLIADDLDLGKVDISFFSPPSPIEENGHDVTTTLYMSENGFEEDECLTESFFTNARGKVVFTANSGKGIKWDKSTRDDLTFVFRNVFAMCGRARLSDMINKSITTDIPTGLVNANGFIAAGNKLDSMGKLHEYTALYINIRNFKYINSRIGNNYGDKVIKTYALMLKNAVGVDGVAARLGGDNFTALVKKDNAEKLKEFLRGAELVVDLDGTTAHFFVQSRAGVYNIKNGDPMHHVMNCISAAVRTARQHPTEFIVDFSPEILYKLIQGQEISADFPNALENKEFLVYYQPKVDLETKTICGGEALVRWKKNDKLIPPMDFIPVFERNGNICALDFYMLENVCRNIRKWKEKGIEPVTISVNFSKMHLLEPDTAEHILAVIRKYGIEERLIEIEMTELSDYSDYEAFGRLVNKLKSNGVTTSIDDFGTGFSSLNLLTDFMFDIVKLDKSFLDNIVRNKSATDEIVVRNIVRMIAELNMKSVAEGVEIAEQASFLKDIGCSMVQGYLFDKPLPEDEFITRLNRKSYSIAI